MISNRMIRRLGAAVAACLVLLSCGCGWIQTRNVKVSGKVLLSGAPVAGHGGTQIDFDGMRQTFSRSDGSFELSGVVNGDDPYVVTFSHPGYRNGTYSGTIKLPKESNDDIPLTIPDVTLTP